MWQLIITNEEGDNQTLELEGVDSQTIGRLPENSICLQDNKMSRKHCQIDYTTEHMFLTDLDSKHGTLVNDQTIFKIDLVHGDVIKIGTTSIEIVHVPEKA
jgi:pSer/pThr/pTyr-binding forkhead associated (FHA) protein